MKACETKGINVENMTAICDCKLFDIVKSNLIKDNDILNNLVGEIYDMIDDSNIFVLKCY